MTSSSIQKKEFTKADLEDLREAKRLLENISLTMRIANTVGKATTFAFENTFGAVLSWIDSDAKAQEAIQKATHKSLEAGLNFAVNTLDDAKKSESRDWLHKLLTVSSGAVTGIGGFATILADLPFSTWVILRSVADIAKSEGHDLAQPEIRFECLSVLGMGGDKSADVSGSEYWRTRRALAVDLKAAAAFAAKGGLTATLSEKGASVQAPKMAGFLGRGLARLHAAEVNLFFYRYHHGTTAPIFVRLINKLQVRYGYLVTQQTVAKAIPVVGAVSGVAINYAFINHFQDMARGHFIVKRLETKYGTERVQEQYTVV